MEDDVDIARALLEKIQQGEELIRSLNPFMAMFEGGFGGMFNPFGDDSDDDGDEQHLHTAGVRRA